MIPDFKMATILGRAAASATAPCWATRLGARWRCDWIALRHGVSHASELDARAVRRDGHMLSVPHTIKHDTPTFQSNRLAQWRSARDKARNSAAREHWLCARGIFSAFF